MKVLITGFAPSTSHPVNTSYEVKNALKDEIDSIEIIKEDLISSYQRPLEPIEALIETHHPDVFICMGQALRREVISLEKVGINYQNEERDWAVDEDGFLPKDRAIIENGPDGIFSNLPLTKMLKHMQEEGFPCEISLTAGAIGCNNALYSLMYLIRTKYPNMMGGFIHVPAHHQHPRRLGKSYDAEYLARGVEAALKGLLD
jgi:pyroglutamyl-peptidase